MSDSSPEYPRLFPTVGDTPVPLVAVPRGFDAVFQDFEELTGWVLGFAETTPSIERRTQFALGPQAAEGSFYIEDLSESVGGKRSAVDRAASEKLAKSLTSVFAQLTETRNDLRKAHAELATMCTLEVRPDNEARQWAFFQQLLKSAIDLLGYESAALCVLNEQTNSLVFRVVAGTHFEDRLGYYRDLRICRGDVAAMSGNVLTLGRRAEIFEWETPVACRSAVCVPVASLDNIMGTLWLTGDRRRTPSNDDLQVLEIIAGRIACEMERRSLLRRLDTALVAAKIVFQSAPHEQLVEAWTPTPFADWTISSGRQCLKTGPHREHFSIWRVTAEDKLAVLLAELHGVDAAAQANCLRTSFDVLSQIKLEPQAWLKALLGNLNQHFDAPAIESLACMIVDPLTGECQVISAGKYLFGCGGPETPIRRIEFSKAERVPRFLPRQSVLVVRQEFGSTDDFLIRINRK
ncbi:MAG: GAF domain-containing protein [Pirellulaceae bacterium]